MDKIDKILKTNPRKKKTKKESKKKKEKRNDWTVIVTEVIDNVEKCSNVTECALDHRPGEELSERVDDQDSAFESDEYREDSDFDETEPNKRVRRKSAITSFLPPQHLLWSWSDEGHKLSAKARRVYHDSIEKDDETMHVGDCAVFLSTSLPDRPYIGRIHSMWQTAAGNMKVQVRWFYHPAEVEGPYTAVGGGRVEDIKTEGALFSSSHYDENDVQTISHKCQVMQCGQFHTLATTGKLDRDGNEEYYLAGEYDPVEGTIVFAPGVF